MKHQTPDSLKFKRLARRLGLPRYVVVGLLESLWIATQTNAPQGDIGRFSNEDISIYLDWEGDPDELISHLIETGWLDSCSENRLVVHDWEEHCPGWVKRMLKRTGKAVVIAKRSPVTVLDSKTVTNDVLEPTPNLTKPNLTKPNLTKDSSAVETTAKPTAEIVADDPVVIVFPCNGAIKEWGMTRSMVDQWQESFPEVDIESEAKSALSWVRSNQKKTAGGMKRFLDRWFRKANDDLRKRGVGSVGCRSSPARRRTENNVAAIREFCE